MKRHAQPTPGRISNRPEEKIDSLVLTLHSKDGMEREQARQSLVKIGKAAAPRLIPLLQDQQERVRWEVCKALMDIGDPSCVPALITALEDESSDVRWVASEALITFGHAALASLVQALIERPKANFLCESAHHILHDQNDPGIKAVVDPLLKVLDGLATEDTVCLVAERTLKKLRITPWN